MPQPLALLDTDILSELLKQHPLVTQRARLYLAEHNRLTFSIITQYEILRGLKAKQARTQEAAFIALCQVRSLTTHQRGSCSEILLGSLHFCTKRMWPIVRLWDFRCLTKQYLFASNFVLKYGGSVSRDRREIDESSMYGEVACEVMNNRAMSNHSH